MSRGDEMDTRARLLEHGRDLYLAVGPARFSLREVARRAGVTAPAVYRHFDSKEALFDAVCEEGFRVFSGYLLRALAEKTPLARLRAAGDHYLRFGLENPRDYRVIFMRGGDELGALPAKRGKREAYETAPTFQFLVDRVRECIAQKELAKGDPVEMAAVIWAHVHGLVSLRLSGHLEAAGDDAAFAKFFRRSTDALLAGLAG